MFAWNAAIPGTSQLPGLSNSRGPVVQYLTKSGAHLMGSSDGLLTKYIQQLVETLETIY